MLPGMMMPRVLASGIYPEFIGAGTPTNNSTDTNAANTPAACSDGDILVAIAYNNTTSRTLTASGWTTRLTKNDSAGSYYLLTKTAASEGATSTFTWSAAGANSAVILAYRGGTNAFDQVSAAAATTGSTTAGTPSMTTSSIGTRLALIAVESAGISPTSEPSGMAQRLAYIGANPSLFVYELSPSPIGVTGQALMTFATNKSSVGGQIQIK
jgi:hypothetical protein